MSNTKKARLELIISMTVFGTIGIFVRNIPLLSGEVALYRAVLAALMLCAYFALARRKIDFAKIKKELWLLFASGAAMGINWILLFEAYKYTSISAATLSYYFAPVLVTVLCPLLFKEKLGARQIICFVMSTIGVVLVIGIKNLSSGGRDLIGILFGLGAALFYAAVVLINKHIKTVSGIERTFLQFVAATVVLLPYVACSGGFNITSLDARGLIFLLIVGLVHTGITYCLYFSSLRELPGQEAAILSYIDPAVAVIVSIVFLGEAISPLQIVGGVLIIGFAVWNEIPAKKK